MSGTVVTDHRMVLSVSPQQTTLYDQVKYTGAPSSFAWVLPIHGPVTVGVSSDVLFQALDQVTQTTIVAPQLPPCPPAPSCPCCGCQGFASGSSSGGAGSASLAPPPVTVLSESVVGPYDQVQLHSTDPMALSAWLTANGYAIPTTVAPIVAAYVSEGFDFLAIKLVPGTGVQAMRPISVTSTGAGVSLPLRMVAAGTGATVGITLWVVATGRYAPMNFPTFTVSGAELSWDWAPGVNSSNYSVIRSNKEAALNNAAWQIESSLDVSPYQVENIVLNNAPNDYSAVPPSDGGAAEGGGVSGDGGGGFTADQVRKQDLATCFPGGGSSLRITRMRADLSQAALANDLVLQAAADQSTMSNRYQVANSIHVPACTVYPPIACAPCPAGDDGGGGVIPLGDDGGLGGGGGGGATSTQAASPGQQSFGCATSPNDPNGGGTELALAGLVGLSIFRARSRKRRG